MKTIQPQDVPTEQKNQLREIAGHTSGDLHALLMHLSSTDSDVAQLTFAIKDEFLTPNEAAELLGMSRTHLTKILDRGGIPFELVGSHKKIRASNVAAFAKRRDSERRDLAKRFAIQDQTRNESIDEISKML